MKKHVFMLSERDLYAKSITSAEKNDIFFLLYSKDKGQISVSDFQLYTDAKCKIQFVETPSGVNDETAIAFTLGKIIGTNPDVIIDSKDPLISKLVGTSTPVKRTRKPRNTTTPAEKPVANKKKTDTNEVKFYTERAKEAKETKPRKPRTKKNEDISDFDRAYNDLLTFLSGIKTKDCDPSANMNGIIKAISTMESENMTFDKAIQLYVSSATAKKLIANIKGTVLTDLEKKVKRLQALDQ